MDLKDLKEMSQDGEHPHAGHPRGRRWLLRPVTAFRNNFLAGLVVVVPIAITLWLIWTFVGWIDSWVMPFVPGYYHPDALVNRWFGDSPWFIALFGENVHVNIRGVGVVLFLTASIADVPAGRAIRAVLPFLAPLIVVLAAVTFVPALTTWLPRMLGIGG